MTAEVASAGLSEQTREERWVVVAREVVRNAAPFGHLALAYFERSAWRSHLM